LRARLGRAATPCSCPTVSSAAMGGYEVFIDSHSIGNTTVLTNVLDEAGKLWRLPPHRKCWLGQHAHFEIAPEPTGHGLPLGKCEAYNRVYEQSCGSS